MLLRSTTEHEDGDYQLSPLIRGTPRFLRQGVPTACLPGTHPGASRHPSEGLRGRGFSWE
jgi:hypothetical protein